MRGRSRISAAAALAVAAFQAAAILSRGARAQDAPHCDPLPEYEGVNLAYKKFNVKVADFEELDIAALDGKVPQGAFGNYSCNGTDYIVADQDYVQPFLIFACTNDPSNPKKSNYATLVNKYPFGYVPELICFDLISLLKPPPPPAPPGYGGDDGGQDYGPLPPPYPPHPPAPPKSRCRGGSTACGFLACCGAHETCYADGQGGNGLCCPANSTRCGSGACCVDDPDITCHPEAAEGAGLCCAAGTFACHEQCCKDEVQVCQRQELPIASRPPRCCDKDKICGIHCCWGDQECVEGSEGAKVCCSPGKSPCGRGGQDQACCNQETEYCIPGGGFPLDTGLCCPNGHSYCGDPATTFCCSPEEVCVNTANSGLAACCKRGLECYHGCCLPGETCKENNPGRPITSLCCREDGSCYRPLFQSKKKRAF